MTNPQAKTLQIFLPTGEPRGIRIAELTTRIVQVILIPRSELAEAKKRPELDQPAVYMLFGESEESAKPIVTEPMEADLLDAFDALSTLVSALSYPVFEPIIKTEIAEKFFCRGKGADATGEMVEDGFVVRQGSVARLDMVPSAVETVSPMRKKLLEGGILVEQDGSLRFTQDYLFSSPSGAAAVVLGRTANGWIEWKDEDGRTLSEIKRAGASEQSNGVD